MTRTWPSRKAYAFWLSIFSTVLGVLLSSLAAHAKVTGRECSNVFDPSMPKSAFVLSTYADPALYEQHGASLPDKPYDPETYRADEWTRAKLYDVAYIPKFFNVLRPKSAPVTGPFIADYVEARPTWSLTYDPEYEIPQPRSFRYWTYRTQPFFDLFVWRGRGDEAILPVNVPVSTYVPGQGHSGNHTTRNVLTVIQRSLQRIYKSFASQGPERQMLAPIVQEQDRKDLDRTTHFEIGHFRNTEDGEILSEGAGHVQMMISRNASEPLHVEDQWGELERDPGDVIGELGRFDFSVHDKKISRRQLGRDQRAVQRMVLFQKIFSWANHDAKIDRVVFQVNDRVREILSESYGFPLNRAKARRVFQEFEGKRIGEWIFEFDSRLMLEAEKRFMGRLVVKHLEDFFSDDVTPGELRNSLLHMSFSRNEFPVLRALGLIDRRIVSANVAKIELTFTHQQALTALRRLTPALETHENLDL